MKIPHDDLALNFSPEPCYSEAGDFLFWYFTDDPSYAEWINSAITVFKGLD